MRIHLGCGDIYLKYFINVDLVGTLVSNMDKPPKGTTLNKYFTRPFDEALGNKAEVIIDEQLDLLGPWPDHMMEAEEVVMISVIEHLTKPNALDVLRKIYHSLKSGGKLIIDFPDLKKDINRYYDSNPDFLMELIYCNQSNNEAQHRWGYTPDSFEKTLDSVGFSSYICKTIVVHAYPMIGYVVTK